MKRHPRHKHNDDLKELGLEEPSAHVEDIEEPKAPSLQDELKAMYQIDNRREARSSLSKLEIVKQPIVRRILVAVLLVLIALAAGLTGSLLLNKPFAPKGAMLEVQIETPEHIVSGTETTIVIPYKNPSNVPLANLEVTAHIPETFIVTSTQPPATDTTPFTWTVGSIEPQGEGRVALTGMFLAHPGSATTIQATTRFVPANFSSPFEDIVSKSILIEDSAYHVALAGPERAIPEEKQMYSVTVTHDENASALPLRLQLIPPASFVVESVSVKTDEEGVLAWTLSVPEDAPPADTPPFVVDIEGHYTSDKGTAVEEEMKATLAAIVDERVFDQAESSVKTQVLGAEIAVSLIANGQSGDSILLPGDDLIVNVSVNNRGEEAAEDITLELL
ncbi:hypothetical protein HYV72_01325, partial [Candidatus Uhrbacteria bacterium]|nr:hypothetical protein [Candidatus Uhrbacteria bacterium]